MRVYKSAAGYIYNINMSSRRPFILADPHLWVVVILFAIGIILHYPQQILSIQSPSLFAFLGLTRHAVERIYFLIPIGYANHFLGNRAGWTSLVISAIIMIPRVFLISDYFADSLLESAGVLLLGSLINLLFMRYRTERSKHERMLAELKVAHEELKSHAVEIEKREKRLDTVNKISNAISQSLKLKQVLDQAVDCITDLLEVDAAWIYLLNEDNSELVLTAQKGYSDEFKTIKVGYGISGKVVISALPVIIEDVSKWPELPKSIRQQLRSVIVVPLRSQGKVNGTFGVNSRSWRSFDQGEIDMLTAIGNWIGVAVENSKLYESQLEVAEKLSQSEQRYRELFAALSKSHEQLKESQQQLIQAAKLTSLGQLAASVAHEVNNPLFGVLVYTQLLRKKIPANDILKETILEYLSKMEFELQRSTKLIRSLLDFGRQSPPALKNIDLNDAVNRAFDLAAHSAELQHIEIHKEMASDLPLILADPEQLQQVFTNLLLNAIQAMPSGGVLTVRSSASNDVIKLEVKDTGSGIKPENMAKLFTPFFTTKPEVKGVGLGLAVAYGIIQRHNGQILVASEVGKGSTFTVILPINQDTAPNQ
jgi:signal transduction histidine kinase